MVKKVIRFIVLIIGLSLAVSYTHLDVYKRQVQWYIKAAGIYEA